MYEKQYLSTWVIALCCTFSFLVFPLIVGIVLLILQIAENKKLKQKYGAYDQVEQNILAINQQLYQKNNEIEQKNGEIQLLESNIQKMTSTLSDLKNEKITIERNRELEDLVNSFDFSSFESYSSEECKNKLSLLKQEEKQLLKDDKAVSLEPSNSKTKDNNNIKQIIRCFNSECDNIILSASSKNIETLRNKLTKSFDTINKIFKVDGVQITVELLEYKLKELTLIYEYEVKYQQEKDIQKDIKEQMIEEEKARKELEKRRIQIEKDQKQFTNEVSKLMQYLQKTDSEVEKQLYADKIKELEEKIKALETEKENVVNREQNAKAGFVYIISNIGSFGEDIYKIGMTRRLEPMDRIKELSSASVPFEFDVHAMIFSEDAPALESSLHSHFDKNRVNKINPRKEFFKVSVDEIEKFVDETFDKTVEFTKVPVAKEYRDSLALIAAN